MKIYSNYSNSKEFSDRMIMTIASTLDAKYVASYLYHNHKDFALDLETYITQFDVDNLISHNESETALEPTKIL